MGVLGKILVFVNLIFSLLTAGLIIVVFTTRTNWKVAFDKQSQNMQIVQSQAQADVEAAQQKVLDKDKQYQALDRERKAAEAARAKIEEDLKKAKDDRDAMEKAHGANTQTLANSTQELNRRKQEVEGLQKQLVERDQKIADIDTQMAKLRDEKVQYEVQYKAAKEKIASLMSQNESLVRENSQLKATLGNFQSTPSGPSKSVPPEDARGTVKRLDGDMATISIGSDAGIAVGNVLTVYRLRPRPEYLGQLSILAVTPMEAVGRLTGPKRSQVKAGDEVAARVLPER